MSGKVNVHAYEEALKSKTESFHGRENDAAAVVHGSVVVVASA